MRKVKFGVFYFRCILHLLYVEITIECRYKKKTVHVSGGVECYGASVPERYNQIAQLTTSSLSSIPFPRPTLHGCFC